jgi:hypothetical protein
LPVPIGFLENAVNKLSSPQLNWARRRQRTAVIVTILESTASKRKDVTSETIIRYFEWEASAI